MRELAMVWVGVLLLGGCASTPPESLGKYDSPFAPDLEIENHSDQRIRAVVFAVRVPPPDRVEIDLMPHQGCARSFWLWEQAIVSVTFSLDSDPERSLNVYVGFPAKMTRLDVDVRDGQIVVKRR